MASPRGASQHVSASRSGPHLVTVFADAPVGVDVTAVRAVATRWDASRVLAPGEAADTPEEQARTWARKEAILKARGSGLTAPMNQVRLAEEHWVDIDAPRGFVAVVSLLR